MRSRLAIYIILLLVGLPVMLRAKDHLEFYGCYGSECRLIFSGRALRLDEDAEAEFSTGDGCLSNLWHNLGLFHNHERKQVELRLRLFGKDFLTKTDDEGYFQLQFRPPRLPRPGYQSLPFYIQNASEPQTCKTLILSSQGRRTGIISDFDDTLIVSHATSKRKLLAASLLQNYKQRKPVAGMADRIRSILHGQKTPAFFVISASPKQLNRSIHRFLDYHSFPPRIVLTKKIHGEQAESLRKHYDYKFRQIEGLIRLYPGIRWHLFGDSGQSDPQIYLAIQKKYPEKILSITIRKIPQKERTQ